MTVSLLARESFVRVAIDHVVADRISAGRDKDGTGVPSRSKRRDDSRFRMATLTADFPKR